MQATWWPGDTSCNVGTTSRQAGIANGQRGWKWHPDGGFAELGTYRLLLALQDSGTLHGLADAVLGPLREHDARRGGELETTLRAFLDHDGQWAATAAALHIHVNTLRNRLTKIAELTGKDVSRTEDRVDLFLALEASAMG